MNGTVIAWAVGIAIGLPVYLAFACAVGRWLKNGGAVSMPPADPAASTKARPGSSS